MYIHAQIGYSLPTFIAHVRKHFLKQLLAPVTLSVKQKEKET